MERVMSLPLAKSLIIASPTEQVSFILQLIACLLL